MVLMSDIEMASRVIQQQLASAIQVVMQVSRLQDGSRKVVSIAEVQGIQENRIEVQDIFRFERLGVSDAGKVQGQFRGSGERPKILERLRIHGVEIPPSILDEVVNVNV